MAAAIPLCASLHASARPTPLLVAGADIPESIFAKIALSTGHVSFAAALTRYFAAGLVRDTIAIVFVVSDGAGRVTEAGPTHLR